MVWAPDQYLECYWTDFRYGLFIRFFKKTFFFKNGLEGRFTCTVLECLQSLHINLKITGLYSYKILKFSSLIIFSETNILFSIFKANANGNFFLNPDAIRDCTIPHPRYSFTSDGYLPSFYKYYQCLPLCSTTEEQTFTIKISNLAATQKTITFRSATRCAPLKKTSKSIYGNYYTLVTFFYAVAAK